MTKEIPFTCHDCGKIIKFAGKKILNGKYLRYESGDADYTIFKCDICYKKDKSLRLYAPCEVYSRVVGYYRPVQQWNEAKQAEYADRKNFNWRERYKKIKKTL